jgi:tetratricopeptide (TPR) repeat protein
MAMALSNKSIAYAVVSREKSSILMEAAKLYEETAQGNPEATKNLAHTYCNIGLWYSRTNGHDSAAFYFDKALATVPLSGDKYETIFEYTLISEYLFERGNLAAAKRLAQQTIELIYSLYGTNHSFDRTLKR